MFNNYDRVIISGKPDAKYKISGISLEYEIVSHQDLARQVSVKYQDMALPYDKILNHSRTRVNKSDTIWNWSFSTPCKSLKGILVLLEEEKSFMRDTSKFYNPKIQKVSITVKGNHN